MTKLDRNSVSLFYPKDSHTELGTANRLIVLVPAEADCTTTTRPVWELAHALGCHILFISLCPDAVQEASCRRQLVTMAAMVQDGKVWAEARIEFGSSWVNAVKSNLKDGDTIVCFAEQRAGLLHRPLSQILQANLNAPVYILSGLYSQESSQSYWLSRIMAWTGSIGIIAGSAFLQIRITALSQDWAQTVLLTLSVIGEVWLIWSWNNLFG